jgi:hypothetical protein
VENLKKVGRTLRVRPRFGWIDTLKYKRKLANLLASKPSFSKCTRGDITAKLASLGERKGQERIGSSIGVTPD